MYKGKALIIGRRPFWRHPIFPWGRYAMIQDTEIIAGCEELGEINPDGFYHPNDGVNIIEMDGGYWERQSDGQTFKWYAANEQTTEKSK